LISLAVAGDRRNTSTNLKSFRKERAEMKKMGGMCIVMAVMTFCLFTGSLHAQEKLEPVPEIDFLTWVPAKFMAYYETSNYIAEEWRKLGLRVNLNQQNMPNPLLNLWFKEHNFDCVVSVLSGLPYRMEPDFFTNSQFNSKNTAPGDWNVGEWSNPQFDEVGDKQLTIYDPEKRKPLIDRLQEILQEEQPETVVYYEVQNMGINTRNCDLDYIPAPDGLRSIWNQVRLTPKKGVDLLKVGRISDQQTWNPVAAIQSDDFEMLRMVYDYLVQIGPKGQVEMWAAEKLEPVDDVTIDVTLKKGRKFSDGKALTAGDVKFTYEYMKEWKAAYFLKYLAPIKSIDQMDDYKLRFHLEKPFAPFIMNTLGQVPILPEHIWKDVVQKQGLSKPQDYRNIPVVGSGAYIMEYWKEAAEYLLKANKDHFMAPKADLLFIVFGSRELCNLALKKGTIDVNIQSLPPEVVKDFSTDKDIKIVKVPSNGYTSIRYQTVRPIFKHKALRVALSHAIPYQRIIDEVLGGYAGTSASPITPVNSFWHNSNLQLREYDLNKARAILKEAGFRWDKDGRLCFPPSN
jgi:peptide/nickel transport system substrate-binding protein